MTKCYYKGIMYKKIQRKLSWKWSFLTKTIFVQFGGHIFNESSTSQWAQIVSLYMMIYLSTPMRQTYLKSLISHQGILMMLCQYLVIEFHKYTKIWENINYGSNFLCLISWHLYLIWHQWSIYNRNLWQKVTLILPLSMPRDKTPIRVYEMLNIK